MIGIIGIIASFLLASLTTASAKSRDRRRIIDLKLIQSALELYAKGEVDVSYPYPTSIYSDLTFRKYLTKTPTDPLGEPYIYLAPACVKPASSPSELALVAQPKTGSPRELIGRDDSVGDYCQSEFGFVPYALVTNLEQPSTGTDNHRSIITTGPTQFITSNRPPLY